VRRARCGSHATLVPLRQPEKAMGHESPIEPWLASDNRATCGSPNGLALSHQNDENRWKGKPKAPSNFAQRPEIRERKATTILLNGVGWRPIKFPAGAEVFFLEFSFYRTCQELTLLPGQLGPGLSSGSRPLRTELWGWPAYIRILRAREETREVWCAIHSHVDQTFLTGVCLISVARRFLRLVHS